MPRGLSDGYAPTRQLAKRDPDAPDAVDWPDFTLNGQPIFRGRAEERIPLKLRKGAEAASFFQLPSDDLIQPGEHWFRAIEWRSGRRHIYTADTAARTANAGEGAEGRYELWTFPIRIKAQGAPLVKNVILKAGDVIVYKRGGPWRSLTLLLPANQAGRRYELSVDGRPPVQFDVGLMPVKLGSPREQLFAVNAKLPGEPAITVQALTRPTEFPNPREWAADLAALAQPLPSTVPRAKSELGPARLLGVLVPRSPVTVYGMALPHGRSGGFFGRSGRVSKDGTEEYAARIADLGFDTVFEQGNSFPSPADSDSIERRAAALLNRGVKIGLQYDNSWSRPALQHPNVAFFAHTLPEWHAPLYRSLSIAAQRFSKLENFAGFSIGSDNAGYVSSWHWAPPVPDRPWGEAMTQFMASAQPEIARGSVLGKPERPFEKPTKDTAEFIKYVARYESTFRQYGYFAEAVKDVDPRLVFTTGSFGSAAGAGGRGGWPWASIPGRPIFEGLPVQQAYDWNELHAAKPLHLVALLDRLRSYSPRKKTWALVDNSRLLYGREAFQRAIALMLTRGVQGVGTNFLPANPSENGRSEADGYLREMHDWIHRYGGVFARTEPLAPIGIFYGHHQAVQRPVVTGENPPDELLYNGSHEGKVAEALFLCHAAGWPARVITYQEIRREPLPPSMKAILLVGLDQPDASWHWAQGLEEPLQQFLKRGGRILVDETSFAPVPATKTGLRVASYVPQSNVDPTPMLLERNRDNVERLQAAMHRVENPPASSGDPTLWAIPSECGDVQYITAVNQAYASGDEAKEFVRPADPKATKPEIWKTKANASLYVKPQTGTLQWNTQRPIYDVRLGRKLSSAEATTVDLTRDAFQWFALPPAEIVAPELTVQSETTPGSNSFYEALVTIRSSQPIRGVPVKLTVTDGQQSIDVFGASGWAARLPVTLADRGTWTVVATELLSGLSTSTTIQPPGLVISTPAKSLVQVREPEVVGRFAARKHVALTIALTPGQERDSRVMAQARALENFYREQGRIVSLNRVDAGGVVESLQPLRSPNRYPQWKTVPSDLVLFGTPASNVLLLDQARAQLFENPMPEIPEKDAVVFYTRSPFVGEYDVVNICATDVDGIEAAVRELTTKAKLEAHPAQ
ncbi:hypothetical protein ACXR0O_21100 [Verrucomicrobiota bacterium sgz303538]